VSDLIAIIDRRIALAIVRFRIGVEAVRQIAFGTARASAKGVDDHEIDMEVVLPYGFQSSPPDGAEGVALKVDGRGATSLLLGYRVRSHEVALQKGELRIFDDQVQEIFVRRGGIEINSGGATIKIDRATGQIDVTPKPGAKVKLAGGGLEVARRTDPVAVTIPPGTVLVGATGAVFNAAAIQLTGTVTAGDPQVEA